MSFYECSCELMLAKCDTDDRWCHHYPDFDHSPDDNPDPDEYDPDYWAEDDEEDEAVQ